MESSPLRFLDYDMSLMLADQVRISQEEESRTFHDNLFENSHEINLNWENHQLMSHIFEDVGYLLYNPVTPYNTVAPGSFMDQYSRRISCINKGLHFRDEKVKLNISDFKRCYDVCVKTYIENTCLQRCGYNY